MNIKEFAPDKTHLVTYYEKIRDDHSKVLKTAKGNPVKMRSVDDLLREVDHLNQIEKNNLLEEHEKPYDPKNIPSVKDSLEGMKSMQDDEKAVGLLQKDSLCAGLIGIPFE